MTPVAHAAPASATPWPIPPFVRASFGVHAAAGAAMLLPGGWPWALAAVAANHAALTLAGLWPRSSLLGPNIRTLPAAAAQRGDVALTIDDGPDPEVTPAVLDLLASHGARATFFCIAERARQQPALVRRIVAEGHSVQNHSLRHSHNFSLLGQRGFAAEIGAAQDILSDLTGVRPHCFRAPAGLRNPLLDPVLHRLKLHLVSWSKRGYDTRQSNPAAVASRLLQGLAGGSILLLHDGHAQRGPSGRAVLLDVLPQMLQALRAQKLQAVTLSDALPPRNTTQQPS